nr:hypothetical protein [Mycolicibacterium malmesburyense]CRL67187.1 hypothetical protein CPGR_00313 [Mycolicibacterium malmesburyense]
MSSPEQPSEDADQGEVPPAAPAYSTPPPEGLPSADDEDVTE